MQPRLLLILLLALPLYAIIPSYAPPAPRSNRPAAQPEAPLGSETNPVKCQQPVGQRAYLSRLRGPDGKPPRYRRIGNVGAGVHGNVVDLYEVTCGSNTTVQIYMDMYHHGHIETNAVPGYTIVPPPEPAVTNSPPASVK